MQSIDEDQVTQGIAHAPQDRRAGRVSRSARLGQLQSVFLFVSFIARVCYLDEVVSVRAFFLMGVLN
jgi:hypothetical protein